MVVKLFNAYRHRSRTSNFKSNKKSRAFKTNTISNSMTFDDLAEEYEISSGSDAGFYDNAKQEEEEEEEKLLENMTVESQRHIQDQSYVNSGDDRDIVISQRRPLNGHQQLHNRMSHGKHRTKRLVAENNGNRLKKLRSELNQLRSDFTDAVSKLFNHMDSDHEKVEKRLKMFSKSVQQTIVASGLDKFRRDGEIFPDVVWESRSIRQKCLKKLFSPAEMSESILYSNDNHAKPGLDANRMKLFKDVVCARFKISEPNWNEFFNIFLRRTLTQMICDVRRKDRNGL